MAAQRAGHIPELDGIRGIAIGLILLIHFWPNVGAWRAGLRFTEVGWIGVDLFFVLSGYLITGILLDSVDRADYYRRFYLRRVFRIFPLYYAFLIPTIVFAAFWHGGFYLKRLNTEWGSAVWFFLYLGNFVSANRGTLVPFAPLAPTWSLHIEEQFYLCFPFLVRRLGRKVWKLLVGLFFLALAWRCLMFLVAPANSTIQYLGTISKADSLAAGGLAAFLIRYRAEAGLKKLVRWLMPVSVGAMVTMYCLAGVAHNTPFIRTIGLSLNAVAFAALILWTRHRKEQAVTAVFRWAPLRFLGKISYSLYLLQLPVQSAVKIVTGEPLGVVQRTPLHCLIWLTSAVALAWLSSVFFEKPMLEWGIRWMAAKKLPRRTVRLRAGNGREQLALLHLNSSKSQSSPVSVSQS